MIDKDSQKIPHLKITRTRRRLYDPIAEHSVEADPVFSLSKIPAKSHQTSASRAAEAHEMIMDYAMWSAGVGLIPVPFVDIAAILLIELRMLKKLGDLYGISFSKHRGKALLASLIGGGHVGLFSGSFLKIVPVLGLAGAIIPSSLLAGAITYAVGRVFVQHFDAGGTLLDFKPEKMRQFFAEEFAKGKLIVSERRQDREDK